MPRTTECDSQSAEGQLITCGLWITHVRKYDLCEGFNTRHGALRSAALVVALSTDISRRHQATNDGQSRRPYRRPDVADEGHESNASLPPQRQQPTSHGPQKLPSSLASSSSRSLRRTPRLQERRSVRSQSQRLRPPSPPKFPTGRQSFPPPIRPAQPSVSFEPSGSTSAQGFQKLVEQQSYWPQRSIHISKQTHEAILFALEAIRSGKGVDAKPLTSDPIEEEARMSNLLGGSTPPGGPASTRAQDASRIPAAAAPGRQMLTPTQVMAIRKDRERRKAEQEAAQRQQQEELRARQREDVGVVDGSAGGPVSTGAAPPSTANPAVTAARRRSENVPTTVMSQTRVRPALTTQNQPRPVNVPQQTVDASQNDKVQQNRTAALDKLSTPAVAGPGQPQAQATGMPQPAVTATQPPTRAAFPHAFERWETLSSHWEGITGYWIRRLEANTEELSGKPIDQQMARQVADLSAAGANLFHAVVELQRLRASSERKFQRWFFETRNEQEQSREQVAELERQLVHERENPSNTSAEVLDALKVEKQKAEELVREMRRELQISKEEARRAWEELGRREQEERDRTMQLRNGEPTSIGGVQVVPMTGSGLMPRQYASSQRPQTRDGPISGGPGSSRLGGQLSQEVYSPSQTTLESPDQEQAQFTYHPRGTSPTETDPFTETSGGPPSQVPSQHGRTARGQPSTGAPSAVPRSATTSPPSSRYQTYETTGISSATYQPSATLIPTTTAPPRTGTAGTDRSEARSYIPSISGVGSEEEYHINPDGSYTRDAHGRRIPYNQPIGSLSDPRYDDDDDDDDDYSAEVERERMYAEQYSRRQRQGTRAQTVQPATDPASQSQYVSPLQGQMAFQPEESPVSPESFGSPIQASPPRQTTGSYQREGAEDSRQQQEPSTDTRHRHPTRLSDILEEQSGRTSPSRSSYISGDYPPTAASNGHQRR